MIYFIIVRARPNWSIVCLGSTSLDSINTYETTQKSILFLLLLIEFNTLIISFLFIIIKCRKTFISIFTIESIYLKYYLWIPYLQHFFCYFYYDFSLLGHSFPVELEGSSRKWSISWSDSSTMIVPSKLLTIVSHSESVSKAIIPSNNLSATLDDLDSLNDGTIAALNKWRKNYIILFKIWV